MRHATTDGAEALMAAAQRDPRFLAGVTNLNTHVVGDDGMLKTSDLHYYFLCGRSALDVIEHTLSLCLRRNKDDIRSVLDFACGYGRVIRWLKAYFDKANVVGYDVDKQAVQAINFLFPGTASVIAKDWSDIPDQAYDLIWMGSIITHLSEVKTKTLLSKLKGKLRPGGIIIFTSHGDYVCNRLEAREKLYGLTDDAISQIVDEYRKNGYGFIPYKGSSDYGISISSLIKLNQITDETGFDIGIFIRRGWVGHQDCLGIVSK